MRSNADSRLQVAVAREQFLHSSLKDAEGVEQVIAASWRRSESLGVDPSSLNPQRTEDLDVTSRLVRCAQPVIDRLGDEAADLSLSIALTDGRARILTRRDTNLHVGRMLDRIDFAPGFDYAEGSVGTNGVGTALESGRSIVVLGSEHYHDRLQPFACVGAPVIDPLSGRVEGVLDISSMADHWSPLIHSLVRSAAMDIGRNLLLDRKIGQQALFEQFIGADARGRDALFALGPSLSMANAAAHAAFSPDEQLSIQEHARFLTDRNAVAEDVIVLESGHRVRLRCTRVEAGGEPVGTIVRARVFDRESSIAPSDHARTHVPMSQRDEILDSLRSGAGALTGSTSSAWNTASAEITEAVTGRCSLLVLGERGTGKVTMLTDHFHRAVRAGRSVCFDAARVTADAYPEAEVAMAKVTAPTLYILRNIEALSPEGAERIGAFLEAWRASDVPVSFAATLSKPDADADLPFTSLLAHFHHSVHVPALRFRAEDVPAIVQRMLSEIAPGRQISMSTAGMQLLSRFPWPGNLGQLREALESALRSRPAGAIQTEDLPAYCRTSPSSRRYSPLEEAERDTIVAALIEAGGNRKHAAVALGMARSSLYRKLEYYRITSV